MGSKAAPQYGDPGFSNSAFMGGNTSLAWQLRGLDQVQSLPPVVQPYSPSGQRRQAAAGTQDDYAGSRGAATDEQSIRGRA